MTNVILPSVINDTKKYLEDITNALNIPRDIVASNEEIKEAWERLPRIISQIPIGLRTKGIVKMCIAVGTGLFDSGINYIWNESIVELRNKIKRFGLNIVGEITEKKEFDEKKLNNLQDSELLDLCLKLNLITEEGFFYLDQCREIRNNFSVAHPSIGDIDDNELLNFTNRCTKYALSSEINPIGVKIAEFIESLKKSKFNEEQLKTWCEKLKNTHEAQRELLFSTLYGIYCDQNSNEETRVNSLNIFKSLKDFVTPKINSNLIFSHQNYILNGNTKSTSASQQFFEKIGSLNLLGEKEQHSIIYKACENLINVHYGMNNFYNEPPFAERLYELANLSSIPDSIKEKYIKVVLISGIGNGYGVSNNAFIYYKKMVSNFSPKEIEIMFNMLRDKESELNSKIRYGGNRISFLKQLISGIDLSSIPLKYKSDYEKWVK